MSKPSAAAAEFLRELTRMADRLAAHDIVVRELRSEWSSFGSWRLEASNGRAEQSRSEALRALPYDSPGPEVTRVTWVGKERLLLVATSPTTIAASPNKWVKEPEHPFVSNAEAIRHAEGLLIKRLA